MILIGCNSTKQAEPVKPNTTIVQKVQQVEMPFKGDGIYHNFMLPCKCGGLIVYEPGSCPCFTKEFYPELEPVLKQTYTWFEGKETPAEKYLGKYESITLECGCVLCVYVPGSCSCLEKKYPDLAKTLKEVYDLALKNKSKD